MPEEFFFLGGFSVGGLDFFCGGGRLNVEFLLYSRG